MNVAVASGPSPMMLAHAAVRATARGHLVLYRVGEFYEVLGEDAPLVSRALGLQLTRRRQKDAPDVPMCGIPAGSAEGMVARLLAAGHKVAISEQPPEPGGARPLRLLTPGTTVDDAVLAAGRPNALAVALAAGQAVGFAFIDLSTGETGTLLASLDGSGPALARIGPAEVLIARWPEGSEALAMAVRSQGAPFADLPADPPDAAATAGALAAAYGERWQETLQGFSPPELAALAALLLHIRSTTGRLPEAPLPPRRAPFGDTMEIDAPTLRGLEVLSSASGPEGALLAVIDRTVTAAGARLLTRQLAAPLTSPETIRRRLAMVRFLVGTPPVRVACRDELSGMPDALRACGRLAMGSGGPRDLAAARDALRQATAAAAVLTGTPDTPAPLAATARELAAAGQGACGDLAAVLTRALVPVLPASAEAGGYVAEGHSRDLDEVRRVVTSLMAEIEALQPRYAAETGVKALRIRANNAIGWHVEVPAGQAAALGSGFVLRQGLASTTRFTTAELDRQASALETARERALHLERAAFEELRRRTLAVRAEMARVCHAAAALDLVCGLAQAAAEYLWSEPELDESTGLDIEDGRHPVAEPLLEAQGRTFEPNGCHLGEGSRLWLLTGPNMAGKSTFLRQVALIVLMAQIGSFVPARRARIGIVDKLFSRIGASDDLAAGRSTFMVEMLETAAILNQATPRSLVILDEVGRGTSTHDGLAIAQAAMEHLHDLGCRTLFSTHYHELADAAEAMPHAVCMAMEASAGRRGAVFSYRVVPGRAGRSYGLKVAALAGLPAAVLHRAEQLLAQHSGLSCDHKQDLQ
ncbi:DNA mismatch repair protein MutS [Dankookia rubra]|uniref:DNA mismatch repair protein MutS n=1 Tax=Dankookia rubra TaxID=1442381 RepID=A0A4R5QDD4_9PROT|nr:DNA mismatch repair protein MutS [Dankookia rubra]TDH60461.1 DNA mismatch repair protein MutS [Dankookia rubra]